MNTRAELVQAFEDFQAGRLGTIPAEHAHVRADTTPATTSCNPRSNRDHSARCMVRVPTRTPCTALACLRTRTGRAGWCMKVS